MRILATVIMVVLLLVAVGAAWFAYHVFDKAETVLHEIFALGCGLTGVVALIGAGLIAAIDVLPGHDDTARVVEEQLEPPVPRA